MRIRVASLCLLALLNSVHVASSQTAGRKPPAAITKIGENVFLVGVNRVDTARREVSVEGTINAVTVLEFVANTYGGLKAYESAMTLNTDAISFNAALLLIGLDPSHARPSTKHFDPAAPQGDRVEIWVETVGAESRRFRAEQLVFDRVTNETMPPGPWVYTGSSFYKDVYSADADGVLIGFVHSPAPVIENPRGAGLGRYGSIILNPNLGLPAGTIIKLTVKALPNSN